MRVIKGATIDEAACQWDKTYHPETYSKEWKHDVWIGPQKGKQ